MRRISVVGSSGSGKSTFARQLTAKLGVPHVELDGLFWDPGWTPVADATFRARVDAATAGDAWVADGNYARVRDIVLARADTVVWLDLPLGTCLGRILKRTARRARTGEELWSGNRESWRRHLTRDSLVWWLVTSYRRKRREYEARFFGPQREFPHLDVHRFRTAAEAEAWLDALWRS
jgi:adenylate kinase family enzyme